MVKSHAFLLDPKKVMRTFKLGLIGFMVAGTGFYHFEKPKKRFGINGSIFVFKLSVQFVSCNINNYFIDMVFTIDSKMTGLWYDLVEMISCTKSILK